MSDHINGYALALFSLAKEKKQIKEYKKDSHLILESLKDQRDYIKFMDSKSFQLNQKIEMLQKAFKNINKNILNFLFILAERNKFYLIDRVLNKLISYINENLNINEGVVYSSIKLSSIELKKIEEKTSKILNKKVQLKNKIDSELISGIRIQVDNDIIEDSIISRIEDIKKELFYGREGN